MKIGILASVLFLTNTFSLAAAEIGMFFHGSLIQPSICTINGNNLIEVNFGTRIGISKINGVNYRQPLNYYITCENSSNSGLTLSLVGQVATFDSHALQSNKENLAIRVYQNNKPFTPGSSIPIEKANLPMLEVVPVKNNGEPLTEGFFEVWATLQVDYS